MKLTIEYASFFNRNTFSYVNKKVIDECNSFIYRRSGIYAIINKNNGNKYIGKSKNVSIRLGQHKSLLRNNHHTYKTGELSLIQKAWNKYGEDSFEFKILEFCDADKLNEREQYWIDYYKCNRSKYQQGYNLTDGGDGAYSNQNVKGRIQINNGEIQKMICPNELQIYKDQGFVKGLLPKTIEKINKNRNPKHGEEHWVYGKHLSDDHKKKISESNKGHPCWANGKHLSDEHKENIRNSLTGIKRSEEFKKKNSESKQKPVIQYNKNLDKIEEYDSAIHAENKTGVRRSCISQCCNGKRKSAGGYIWRFKNE